MAQHDRAGTTAQPEDLVDVARLVTAYYTEHPDPDDPGQRVSFGTSGHRGSSLHSAFNDDHIAATSQAIVEHRRAAGVDGPLFLAKDTHALSEPAWATALEVFAANDVTVLVDGRERFTPTPALSHAVLTYNRGRTSGLADGVVVTPSHNPPADGGFKYNPPDGGPAGGEITGAVQDAANALLRDGMKGVRRIPLSRARSADTTSTYDFLGAYVDDLPSVLDLDAVREAGVRIGADPLGGASVDYWGEIADRHRLDLTVVNPLVDPTWRFMTLDWDGKIRMDCSSRFAMASLIANKDEYAIATGNDADADRHGIVTPDAGLLAPNAYLAVAIEHLLATRSGVAAGRRHRQDAGQLLAHRPRGRRARPPAARGAGRLQVVRARTARRVGRLRWRGVGGGVVPAQGRHRLDDRQGRHPALPARLGDPRGDRQHAERALRAAHRDVRHAVVRPGRRAGHPRAEGGARQALALAGHGDRAGRRADHGHPDRGARQRRSARRAQGDHRERLVRRASVRHRGRLQDLRRELLRTRPPGPHPAGGPGDRRCRPRLTAVDGGASVEAVTTSAPGAVVERARVAVAVVFALNGLVFASWVSRLPAVREALGLSTGQLGLLLLCVSVGSVLGLPVSGPLVARSGPARTVLGGAGVVTTGLLLVSVAVGAGSVQLTGVGLFLLGLGIGSWDVAMNVEGADVERRLDRTLMPRFHAGFSVGSVAGALVGATAAGVGVDVRAQLAGTGAVALTAVAVCLRSFLPVAPAAVDAPARAARGPGVA